MRSSTYQAAGMVYAISSGASDAGLVNWHGHLACGGGRHTGKGIADAAVGLNQLLRKVAIYLVTQGADIHLDYVGQTLEGGVPDMLKNHGAGHRAIYIAHQIFEQQEFFRAQIDAPAQPRGCSPHQIQFQITGAQDIHRSGYDDIGGCLTQPYGKAQTHGQLGGEERLAHTIIHAGFEQKQALFQIEVEGKNEERSVGIFLAQQPYQGQSIGKDKRIGIDENSFVLRELGKLQALLRGVDRLHNKLRRAEPFFNRL
jgi:hypothetical protein